jgi:hypothetical protein
MENAADASRTPVLGMSTEAIAGGVRSSQTDQLTARSHSARTQRERRNGTGRAAALASVLGRPDVEASRAGAACDGSIHGSRHGAHDRSNFGMKTRASRIHTVARLVHCRRNTVVRTRTTHDERHERAEYDEVHADLLRMNLRSHFVPGRSRRALRT